MRTRPLGRTGIQVGPYCLGGPRTPAQRDDLLAGAAVTLDDEVLDRIGRIVAPGTDLGPLDVAYVPPAVELPALRRRPAAERAAA
jgi:aryl-alcohol dehydrogenase-like predicted oxidoreductase